MQHRDEVVDVTFPPGDEPTEVMKLGDEAYTGVNIMECMISQLREYVEMRADVPTVET